MNQVITVIPVYNGERFLKETLESVARQTLRPDRLIVIDDCSTDGTRELVRNFAEFPCELRVNEERQGLFGNLNRALSLAQTTQHLHILLADDVLLPRFFERVLPTLHRVSGRALAFTRTESIDAQGQRMEAQKVVSREQPTRTIKLRDFVRRQCELQTVLCGSIVLKTDYQPPPVSFRLDMPQTADCVFYAEWARFCTERIEIPEILCQIRYHPFSATSQNVKKVETWVMDEWKAMTTVFPLLECPTTTRWIRQHKLKCLFAARSHVKIAMTRKTSPDFARQIREASLGVVQPYHWALGKMAVNVRNGFSLARGWMGV